MREKIKDGLKPDEFWWRCKLCGSYGNWSAMKHHANSLTNKNHIVETIANLRSPYG